MNAPSRRPQVKLGLDRFSAIYLLLAIMLVFGTLEPDTFLTSSTMRIVLAEQVVVAVLALAVLVPVAAGAFDLSVGANLALSLVIFSWLHAETSTSTWLAAVIAVLCCSLVGLVNGIVVVYLKVNSFIATLGMSQVLAAATLYISDNRQIVGVIPPGFRKLGNSDFLGLPLPVLYLAVIALVVWVVLEHTPAGRSVYMTGGNEEAARLVGIRTDRVVLSTLVASATLAGIAGIIFAAKVAVFSNSFGPPLLFPAFAAVFFGATQIKRRPNVWGTIIAVYTLAFGVKGLQLLFQGSVFWITPLFNGLALLVAVALAGRSQRIAGRRVAGPEPEPRAHEEELPR